MTPQPSAKIYNTTRLRTTGAVSRRHQRWFFGAMESHVAARQTGSWTNEKHVHFLNTMEASFVRAMFENKRGILRLDRYLPDSSESTLDLKAQRKEKHATAAGSGRGRMDGRADKKARRGSSHPCYPPITQDQVVPQLEGKAGSDKD